METATLSKTVKLSNDQLGLLQLRTNEIARRIEEENIDLWWAMDELQRIIEGKKLPEAVHTRRAKPLNFTRSPASERRRSKAPRSKRFPHWLTRLEWPERNPEHIMAEMWEDECIPQNYLNSRRTPIDSIISDDKPTERDVLVIASTLQWLGTNIGQDFLRRFIRVSQLYLG